MESASLEADLNAAYREYPSQVLVERGFVGVPRPKCYNNHTAVEYKFPCERLLSKLF